MMKLYEHPELVLFALSREDILTLSDNGEGGDALSISYKDLVFE